MPSKPLEPVVFFIDHSLGRKVVAGSLRAAGASVVVHDDKFPPDARDEEWLQEAGKNHWVVLTKDDRIRYRLSELSSLKRNRVQAFVLTGKGLTGLEMGTIFVGALPRMIKFLRSHRGPFIAKVTRSGKVLTLIPGSTTN